MADSWKYNEVIFKAAHNSVDRDERPVTRQLLVDAKRPHQASCRGLELDLRESPHLPLWAIDHDEYTGSADRQLTAYLDHLRTWSELNPGHDVVTVHLDIKARARDRRSFAQLLDGTIAQHLGRDKLFVPAQLQGQHRSLVAGAMADGWPTLGRLRGRFILCLSGSESTKRSYAARGKNRLCFADQLLGPDDPLPSTSSGNRVFINYDARKSWDWDKQIRTLAGLRGFIVRAYVVNNDDLWKRTIAAGTNIIATDRIRNHSWARVGRTPFRRLARDLRPPPVSPADAGRSRPV